MTKVRFLFVLFSLIVLAAPARAQSRDRDHGHGRGRARGDVVKRDRDDDETGDRRAEDDDRNDDDRAGRVESDRRRDRDDDEDDDGDDDRDDDRGGISRDGCIDANGNNVCDVVSGSVPATLPEMVNAILISRGQLTRSGRGWLGSGTFTPRFNRSANRTPRQVTWVDRSGSVREVWLDRNGDGRADVVRLYRAGKLVRTVRR